VHRRFYDDVTDVAGKLKELEKSDRKARIQSELRSIMESTPLESTLADGPTVLWPIDLSLRPVGVRLDGVASMQSATRTPVLVPFSVEPAHGHQPAEQRAVRALIFKVGDECRQDMLALQIMRLCRRVYMHLNLNAFLYPYRVMPTGQEVRALLVGWGGGCAGCSPRLRVLGVQRGIIEVVPRSQSRDSIGKSMEATRNLFDYFRAEHGSPLSERFRQIRKNFVESMAGYSVVTYITQAKDRHNGNILITDEGRVVHIGTRAHARARRRRAARMTCVRACADFGFIFDHSPGGDMRFESAPFKLSKEMIQVMGGTRDSEYFRWFCVLCIRAYLAVRPQMESVCALAELMQETQLPCYKPETMARLRARFTPGLTERRAAAHMQACIDEYVCAPVACVRARARARALRADIEVRSHAGRSTTCARRCTTTSSGSRRASPTEAGSRARGLSSTDKTAPPRRSTRTHVLLARARRVRCWARSRRASAEHKTRQIDGRPRR
jgi:phosphatidylinositol 4-kinase